MACHSSRGGRQRAAGVLHRAPARALEQVGSNHRRFTRLVEGVVEAWVKVTALSASLVVGVKAPAGKVASCAIALTNVADRPLFAEEASALVIGTACNAATIKQAAEAATAITDPSGDGRGPAEYRRAMAGLMVARALRSALSRAQGA